MGIGMCLKIDAQNTASKSNLPAWIKCLYNETNQ